jgi:nitroreductase
MRKELELIFKRRSIRKYTDETISAETVQALLEAAMAAPSACCKDPVHFIVMDDPEVKAAVAAFLPNGPFLNDAPLGIAVLGDLDAAHGNSESYMLQDCTAAIENILLAVEALGLGACWLGVHPRPERIDGLREYFKLPENIVPVSVIAVGHPAERKEARTRFDAARVKYNAWRS